MKRKEAKKAKPGRLKIRVVFTAAAAGLFGAACSASPVVPSPCGPDCGFTDLDGGHDGGVDAGPDAGKDGGGRDGGDGG